MSPAAALHALHAQLASVMEELANAAVAEMCRLVDSGYSQLQLEICRSRKENELLRRKLRLAELRATALRAAVTAPLHASGRARAQAAARAPVKGPSRKRAGEAVLVPDSGGETCPVMPAAGGASCLTTPPVIKVEDNEDESWSQSEDSSCPVVEGPTTETEAPPPVTKQETGDEGGDSSKSWMSAEVSSSTSVQTNPTTSQKSDAAWCEGVMHEPQIQHGSRTTQNPQRDDPSCSYVLNTVVMSVSADSGIFPVRAEHQQPAVLTANKKRAPLAICRPQHPVGQEVMERQNGVIRKDMWGRQGGVREDGGGKVFVCTCCGKTLACLKNLKTHMRVHTGEKPFVCSLCGKRFSDASNLKRHQNVHTGEKRYGCVHCGKRFAQSGSLKVHMTVHTDCKQFRCSHCSKTFISGSHLRRHATVHTGETRLAPTSQ